MQSKSQKSLCDLTLSASLTSFIVFFLFSLTDWPPSMFFVPQTQDLMGLDLNPLRVFSFLIYL